MCLYNHIWRSNQRLSLLYSRAFIIVINFLDSPDNMLTNDALYPWGTSVGKDKPLYSAAVCTARVHNSNRGPVRSSNTKGMQSRSICLSSNYVRSGFLLDLLCAEGNSTWTPHATQYDTQHTSSPLFSSDRWGWLLTSFGSPWVAQCVWAIPTCVENSSSKFRSWTAAKQTMMGKSITRTNTKHWIRDNENWSTLGWFELSGLRLQ